MAAVAFSQHSGTVLQTVLERLRAFAPVERLILYGSRARGDHDEDSDWDLCAILPDDIRAGIYTPASMWEAVRDLDLSVQIVPMRRSVFDEKRRNINALAHDVASEGIILYDRTGNDDP